MIQPKQISHKLETVRWKLTKIWSTRALYVEIMRNTGFVPMGTSANLLMEQNSWDVTMATIHSTKLSCALPFSRRNIASMAIDATFLIKTKPVFPSRPPHRRRLIWIVTDGSFMRQKPSMEAAYSPTIPQEVIPSEQMIVFLYIYFFEIVSKFFAQN